METTQQRCGKCRHPLRNPSPDGYGRTCRARLRATAAAMDEALTGLSPDQRKKALALISSGGVKATNRPGAYRVPSSRDRNVTYLVTADNCPCLARTLCYHQGSVRAVEAARAAMTRRAA